MRIKTALLFLTLSLIPLQIAFAQPKPDLLIEINALREEKALPPLIENRTLTLIAQQQADYIAKTGIATHFDASGKRPYQRAVSAGYKVAGDLLSGGIFFENIYAGKETNPQEIVKLWAENREDSKAIYSDVATDIGYGYAQNNGVHYWVINIGASGSTLATSMPPSSIIYTPTSGTASVIVLTTTPEENGAVYHIVAANESLWSISLAYEITVDELKAFNRLSNNDIYISQKLLVKKPILVTSTPDITATVTLGIPSSTPTVYATPSVTPTFTPLPTPPSTIETSGKIVGGIVLTALLAAALGALIGGKKKGNDE